MSLCSVTRRCAAYIFGWLKAQPHVKEESLTDWLLYAMDAARRDVIYRAFSRHEEAHVTGADWEWWFAFPNGAMRMRVQAKKLTEGDNYSSLAYANRAGLQIAKLMEDAARVNAYPLYAFYCAEDSGRCTRRVGEADGVHLASASSVDKLISARVRLSASDVLAVSIPMTCFTCCELFLANRGVEGLIRFIKSRFESNEMAPESVEAVGFHRELPAFVRLLADQTMADDLWLREYQNEIEGTDAILLFDFRKRR